MYPINPDVFIGPNKKTNINKIANVFTPFYISNADFYIVLNHIKIIYSSFLFFLFYFLEHICLTITVALICDITLSNSSCCSSGINLAVNNDVACICLHLI